MKLLLDTHVVLWWINEYEKLSANAKSALLDSENILHLSVASIWEVAIKSSLGKMPGLNGRVGVLLSKIESMPIRLYPIEPRHIEIVEALPFIHRDPFDRMLISTAMADSMTILTTDENIHKYGVLTHW